jgi:hypothetical protein
MSHFAHNKSEGKSSQKNGWIFFKISNLFVTTYIHSTPAHASKSKKVYSPLSEIRVNTHKESCCSRILEVFLFEGLHHLKLKGSSHKSESKGVWHWYISTWLYVLFVMSCVFCTVSSSLSWTLTTTSALRSCPNGRGCQLVSTANHTYNLLPRFLSLSRRIALP